MHAAFRAYSPLAALGPRAVVLWILGRTMLWAATAGAALMGGAPPAITGDSLAVNPVTVILFSAMLGAIDLRRRRERLLWADLGFSLAAVLGVFGAVALTGELVFALMR